MVRAVKLVVDLVIVRKERADPGVIGDPVPGQDEARGICRVATILEQLQRGSLTSLAIARLDQSPGKVQYGYIFLRLHSCRLAEEEDRARGRRIRVAPVIAPVADDQKGTREVFFPHDLEPLEEDLYTGRPCAPMIAEIGTFMHRIEPGH